MWSFHSGRGEFDNLDYYVKALEARYGKARDLDDFARSRRRSPTTRRCAPCSRPSRCAGRSPPGSCSGCSTPPGPTCSGSSTTGTWCPTAPTTRRATPTGRSTSPTTTRERRVVAVNDQPGAALRGAQARVRVLGMGSRACGSTRRARSSSSAGSRAGGPGAAAVERRASPTSSTPGILGADGAPLATNFYWLPARPDVLDWEKSEWYYTPVRRFADLTALGRLPAAASCAVGHRFAPAPRGLAGGRGDARERGPDRSLSSSSWTVAGGKSGRLAAPILWDDNYVSLLPGEKREIRGLFPPHALARGRPAALPLPGHERQGRLNRDGQALPGHRAAGVPDLLRHLVPDQHPRARWCPTSSPASDLSLALAGFLPFAFFVAYGVMSIPAGMLLER